MTGDLDVTGLTVVPQKLRGSDTTVGDHATGFTVVLQQLLGSDTTVEDLCNRLHCSVAEVASVRHHCTLSA